MFKQEKKANENRAHTRIALSRPFLTFVPRAAGGADATRRTDLRVAHVTVLGEDVAVELAQLIARDAALQVETGTRDETTRAQEEEGNEQRVSHTAQMPECASVCSRRTKPSPLVVSSSV